MKFIATFLILSVISFPLLAEKCDIHDSGGFLASIDKRQFPKYSALTARDAESCVLSWIHGIKSTRALYDHNGRVLGKNMTKAQATELKRNLELDRCYILICR